MTLTPDQRLAALRSLTSSAGWRLVTGRLDETLAGLVVRMTSEDTTGDQRSWHAAQHKAITMILEWPGHETEALERETTDRGER